ncbi:MAG: sugar kinase [Candidatus Omnitrophota bacterium]|jgi:sugar/nucleoside kinase (ribokinase family)|nr:MAG: sugar kinase [Candidatus Omnitrophota bacterium]
MSIAVVGTVALDTVKTPLGKRVQMLGGSAVHFAMAARLFTRVNLVAVVGNDFPSRHIAFLQRKGIKLTSLLIDDGKTFQWSGEYKDDLNTAITLRTELGVLLQFRPLLSEAERRLKYLFLANIDPDIQRRVLESMYAPRLIALDSMNYWIRHKKKSLLKLLEKVDMYVANDQEARLLSGEYNLIKAARALERFGPATVLIKKGEHGVLLYSKKFIFSIPAYPTDRVVDPTGAGDTFAGGFMGSLAQSKTINNSALKRAIACGAVAASFNVEAFGLEKTARLTRLDLRRRLAYFRQIATF